MVPGELCCYWFEEKARRWDFQVPNSATLLRAFPCKPATSYAHKAASPLSSYAHIAASPLPSCAHSGSVLRACYAVCMPTWYRRCIVLRPCYGVSGTSSRYYEVLCDGVNRLTFFSFSFLVYRV